MGETDQEDRQIDLIEYIDETKNSGPPAIEKTLSNEQLNSAGLIAVKAFVRSKASKNAERVRKAAERREKGETGPPRKQLNLQAPIDDDAREVLREMNTALLRHSLTADDAREALRQNPMEWRQRAHDAERERDQLRNQLNEAHKQLEELSRKANRSWSHLLGSLRRIFISR